MIPRTETGPGLRASGLGLSVPADASVDRHERRWVLRRLDLALAPGEQAVLVGPSGSGKSSLLHLLAGLASPDEGEVAWHGEPVSRWPLVQREAWRRRTLGLVFQQFHLFAELAALDNVLLPWQFDHRRVPAAARDEARALLAALGVREAARCGQLSRGEQQRVALARALVRNPRLVLADEPTASLDRDHAAQACALLQRLCRERGAILLLATHDLALAGGFDRRVDLTDRVPAAS